jgi:hypothetical protein
MAKNAARTMLWRFVDVLIVNLFSCLCYRFKSGVKITAKNELQE